MAVTAIRTTPRSFGLPKSDRTASALEGRRLAEWTVLPWEVDPSFTGGGGSVDTRPLAEPDDLAITFFDQPVPLVLERNRMSGAFITARLRSDDNRDQLTIAVMEFPGGAAAERAASQAGMAVRTKGATAAAVPGHPDAHGWTGQEDGAAGRMKYLRVFRAHAAQVIYVEVATDATDPTDLAATAGVALDLQAARLGSFQPVPPTELRAQPMDPEGLWSHTVLSRGDGLIYPWEGVYTPRGYLHAHGTRPATPQPWNLPGSTGW